MEKRDMQPKYVKQLKPELEKVIRFFGQELDQIRVGRTSPSLVEDIEVKISGQELTLKELGSISCPNRRQIVIEPWQGSYIEPIQKALSRASLRMTPVVRQDRIFLSLPSLTEERREEFLKILADRKEQARQTIRQWRDKAWNQIQQDFREDQISEDQKYKFKDQLEEQVRDYKEKIEQMAESKRKEIEA